MEIYIHRDGQQLGPFPVESIRDELASGALLSEDMAWYEGAEGWKPLPEVLAELEAVAAPADEPAHDPAHDPAHAGERDPEPEIVEEPEPTSSPEATPVSGRQGEPSWIPPRRDGSASTPFSRPARLARPEPKNPVGRMQPSLAYVPPAEAVQPDPASPPDALADTAPSETHSKGRRRRSAPQEVWNPEMKRARGMIIGGGIAVFTGVGLFAFTHFVTPPETSLKMVAGALVLLGGAWLLFGIYRYRQGN